MPIMDVNTYKDIAAKFNTEEDVRAETNRFLKNTCEAFGIKINDSGHEITSAYGGRADSIYSDVIIEYKSPKINLLSDRGFSEVIDGRNDKDRGLRHYLVNFSLEKAYNNTELFLETLKNKVGVGFNGKAFIFARFIPANTKTELFFQSKTKVFPPEVNSCQNVNLIPIAVKH